MYRGNQAKLSSSLRSRAWQTLYHSHNKKYLAVLPAYTSRLHCLHDSYSLSLSAESLRGIYIQNRDYNEGNRYNRQLPSFAVFWCYNFHKIH